MPSTSRPSARPDAFADLEARLGLDPERDLDQVLLAGREGGPSAGVALVRGRFDRTKLMQAVEAKKEAVTWKSLAGTNVYLFREGSRRSAAAAFLDDRTLVIGSQAGVEATVANRASGRLGLGGTASLVRLLEQVKPGSAFWMVGDQSLLANLPKSLPAPGGSGASTGLTLPNLQSLIVSGELEPALSLSVIGETADEASARNLADLVRGFAALVQLQAAQRPELRDLGSAVGVTTEGSRILLSARFRYELLEALKASAPAGGPRAPSR